jgi:hypothetical protein
MRPIEGTERTVTNLDNGVRIQITSDDPEIVQTIQERFADFPPAACPRGAKGTQATSEEGDEATESEAQE